MFHEYSGRDRTVVQDFQPDANQVVTITFREICDRSNEAGARFAQLHPAFRRRVLSLASIGHRLYLETARFSVDGDLG